MQQGLAFGQRWGQSNMGIGHQSPPPTSGPGRHPPGSSGVAKPPSSSSGSSYPPSSSGGQSYPPSSSGPSRGGMPNGTGYSHGAAGYNGVVGSSVAAGGDAGMGGQGHYSAAAAPTWLSQQGGQQGLQGQQHRVRQPGDDALDSFKAAGAQQAGCVQQQQVCVCVCACVGCMHGFVGVLVCGCAGVLPEHACEMLFVITLSLLDTLLSVWDQGPQDQEHERALKAPHQAVLIVLRSLHFKIKLENLSQLA
jgi:hypothetical protein